MTSGQPYRPEGLLREINSLLPEPVRQESGIDGSTVLVGGDPGEVIVRVTHEEVVVSLYRVSWHGPHTPSGGKGLVLEIPVVGARTGVSRTRPLPPGRAIEQVISAQLLITGPSLLGWPIDAGRAGGL